VLLSTCRARLYQLKFRCYSCERSVPLINLIACLYSVQKNPTRYGRTGFDTRLFRLACFIKFWIMEALLFMWRPSKLTICVFFCLSRM
jgi:hypothetical protein